MASIGSSLAGFLGTALYTVGMTVPPWLVKEGADEEPVWILLFTAAAVLQVSSALFACSAQPSYEGAASDDGGEDTIFDQNSSLRQSLLGPNNPLTQSLHGDEALAVVGPPSLIARVSATAAGLSGLAVLVNGVVLCAIAAHMPASDARLGMGITAIVLGTMHSASIIKLLQENFPAGVSARYMAESGYAFMRILWHCCIARCCRREA